MVRSCLQICFVLNPCGFFQKLLVASRKGKGSAYWFSLAFLNTEHHPALRNIYVLGRAVSSQCFAVLIPFIYIYYFWLQQHLSLKLLCTVSSSRVFLSLEVITFAGVLLSFHKIRSWWAGYFRAWVLKTNGPTLKIYFLYHYKQNCFWSFWSKVFTIHTMKEHG